TAVELEVLRRHLDFERHLDGRLSGLEPLDGSELAALLADLPRDLEQRAPALDRPAIAPFGEGRARGSDRGVAVRSVPARNAGALLTGHRGVRGQIPPPLAE